MDFPVIDPVAFSLGPLLVRWYALAYMAGFLLGWRYALRIAGLDGEQRPNKEDIDDFIPWAIIGVIAGGRLGYILFYHFGFYLDNPLEILKVWRGGMSFHGGALGVVCSLIIYTNIRKTPLLRLSDMFACAVPIGLFFGRIANFVNGELYGRIADVPWAVRFPAGGFEPRHPSQIYEAALEGAVLFAALFFLVRIKKVRERPGVLSGVFLIGYGAFRSFVELFREPDAHIGFVMEHISMGQILSAPMVILGLGLVIYSYRSHSNA